MRAHAVSGSTTIEEIDAIIAEDGAFLCSSGGKVPVQVAVALLNELVDSPARVPSHNRVPTGPNKNVSYLRPDGGPILPHSERSYTAERPDLVLFCCVNPAPVGGHNLFYDGCALSARLSAERIQELSKVAFLSERTYPRLEVFRELWPEVEDPLAELKRRNRGSIRIEENGEVTVFQETSTLVTTAKGDIAFANSATLDFPPHLAARFSQIFELSREFWAHDEQVIPMNAGDFIIFDNWRFMHGRTSFEKDVPRQMFAAFGLAERFRGRPYVSEIPAEVLQMKPPAFEPEAAVSAAE